MVTPTPTTPTPATASHHDRHTLPITPSMSEEELIGRLLVSEGVLEPDQLERALAELRGLREVGNTDARLCDVLIQRGLCRFDQVSGAMRLREQMRAAASPARSPGSSGASFARRPASGSGGAWETSTPPPDEIPEDVRAAIAEGRQAFGKYIVVSQLGKGGMGVVYKAWDSMLGRDVALKLLKGEGIDDQEAARFAREAKTAASLSHPSIVPVYELAEAEGRLYIAMKFIDGKPPIAERLPWKKACAVVRKIALALDYAHGLGVVHRDIKPHNIIIDAEGEPHLMDFGLAKSLEGSSTLTQTGLVLGTPAYISPEQAHGEVEKVGPRSDVYSLGATFYELLAGAPPFVGKTPYQTMRKAMDEDPASLAELVPDLPRDVETVVMKAMAKDLDARYPSARAMADDIERVMRSRKITARRAKTRVEPALTRVERVLPQTAARRAPLVPFVAALAFFVVLAAVIGGRVALRRSAFAAHRDGAAALALEGRWAEARERLLEADAIYPGEEEIARRIRECDDRLAAAAAEREAAEREAAAREDRARRAREAQPLLDAGRRLVEEAGRDLYRPAADLGSTRDQLDRAIVALGQAIEVCPEEAEAYFWRARARAMALEHDGAVADYGLALERDPGLRSALIERGTIQLQRHIEALMHAGWQVGPDVEARIDPLLAAARTDFERAGAIETAEPDLYLEALVAFAERRLEDCIDACTRLIELQPSRETAFKLRADARHFALGNFDDAAARAPAVRERIEAVIADYDRALSLRVSYYEALIMRGYERQALGDYERARADYTRALGMRPEDPLGQWFLASWHLKRLQRHAATGNITGEQSRHHLQTALDLLDRGLAGAPDSYILRMNRAMVLGNLRREDEALLEATRAIELNPGHYFGWYTKGSLEARVNEWDAAIASLERSIELAPTFASSWYNLGLIHRSQGHRDEAIRCLNEALAQGHPAVDRVRALLRDLERR